MEIDTIDNAETQSHDASAADMIRDIDQRLQQLRQQEWQLSQNPRAALTELRTIRDDIRNLTHLQKDLTALVNRPEVSGQSQSPDLQEGTTRGEACATSSAVGSH